MKTEYQAHRQARQTVDRFQIRPKNHGEDTIQDWGVGSVTRTTVIDRGAYWQASPRDLRAHPQGDESTSSRHV
jgi:hypothetical protein